MDALARNFKCPICGNEQIYLTSLVSMKPYYTSKNEAPAEYVKTVAGHCGCCGFIMEFNLNTLMKGNDPK